MSKFIEKLSPASSLWLAATGRRLIRKVGSEHSKAYRRTEAEYRSIQQSYRQYLNEVAEKGLENTEPPTIGFLTDPMTFAHRLRQ